MDPNDREQTELLRLIWNETKARHDGAIVELRERVTRLETRIEHKG